VILQENNELYLTFTSLQWWNQ